jgi:ribose transport system ATP-binding protein
VGTGVEAADAGRRRPVVDVRHLSKAFGGVFALRDVALAVRPGEIHGLLGQNGSGKSTLIKILAGYHEPEPGGELQVDGEPVDLPLRPGQFRELGISFVHQDLGLVETLTVLDNLRVGRYDARRARPISWREERRRVRAALARYDLSLSPDTKVARLRDVERAQVAIVRAVQDLESTERTGLLVLDEPTVYLPRDSVERLFAMMREVAASGKAILFVSHQLGEVRTITDRVTVLRDGAVVGTAATAELSEERLIELILGRTMLDLYPDHVDSLRPESLLSVRGVSGGMAHDVSLDLHAGETLGLTGLVGMGFEDVPYLIYGAERTTSGELAFAGRTVRAADITPQRSIRHGVVLVPANRLRDGIVRNRTVEENVSLPVLGLHFRLLYLRLRGIRTAVRALLKAYDVRPPDPERKMGTLSGGNQQKAVLAKWVQTRPSVLLMHEPTQGVDVGARKQIFGQISEATKAGTAVLIASSEHEDLVHLCDRVLVFRDGRVVSELVGSSLTADRILEESYRQTRTTPTDTRS